MGLREAAEEAAPRERTREELQDALGRATQAANDNPTPNTRAEVRRLTRALEATGEPAAPPSPIETAWRPLDPTWLTEAPNPPRWLLRHQDKGGKPCTVGHGDGLLRRGIAGMLVSAGGVGKTYSLVTLALAVLTGREWLGFYVDREAWGGRVLLALAEEDADETHRRLFYAANALKLSDEERVLVAERLVVLPMAGKPVALLTSPDGRNVTETAELHAIRRKLAEADDWALVGLDPLARWAGADTETDNSLATRFVQAAESLTTVPGGPTVLVSHHSSKLARRGGQVDARGVTALTDGARWYATLREEGGSVFFRQEKSNYSRPMPDELRLVREPSGLLRLPTFAEEEEHSALEDADDTERDTAKDAKQAARVDAKAAELVAALRASKAPVTSQSALKGLVTGSSDLRAAAVSVLMARAVIEKNDGGQFVLREVGQ
jgi:hypothetical protein